MGRTKGGFATRKRKLLYKRQSEAQKQRWAHGHKDHVYSKTDEGCDTLSFEVVDHEEIVPATCKTTTWTEGRRIVELGVLAEGLRACQKCGLPLQLAHATTIQTYGLSAILKIPCSNTSCKLLNNVPTGKRKDRIWDANVKLASATVNAGIGERQLNTLLSDLNIPPVSHTTLLARQRDVGIAFREMAKESTEKALQEEINLTKRKTGSEDLTVSVDAGWQKRGSGRSYDSLSGHCSMIGCESGKVVKYAVRMKSCKICSLAQNSNSQPPKHDCHINWTGSSRAMESDMVEEMVKEVHKDGCHIDAIVGDEDTTTIARLRANVNKNIKKLSDANHVKKLLGNSLYSIKKDHKKLTFKIIQYLQRCLSYILAQGKGDPDMIRRSVLALGYHPFGNHSMCSSSWCRFVENPKATFKSLPGGKPLNDVALQNALCDVFKTYASNADKLAALGSSQANENFNRIVSSKAPKSNHYSSSGSLLYRIDASVSQKNEGHKCFLSLNKRMGLSPGLFTERLAKLRDLQHAKRKAIAGTYKSKQRRRFLKSKRQQNTTSNEVREGTSYAPGCALEECQDIQNIPAPIVEPPYIPVETMPMTKATEVIFDLETTGLARTSHILQIAAIKGEHNFNEYILPKAPIPPKVRELTGIRMEAKKMYHHDKEVKAVNITTGLTSFLDFLASNSSTSVVLFGHNIKKFDVPVLCHSLLSCGIMEKFVERVDGFVDTHYSSLWSQVSALILRLIYSSIYWMKHTRLMMLCRM